MRIFVFAIATFLAMSSTLAPSHAAFVVEAFVPGKANGNFSSLGHSTSATPSTAVGTTAAGSVFGNPANSTGPDQYTFSYTPGVDIENTAFATATVLGNSSATDADGAGPIAPVYLNVPQLATGRSGGGSGIYKVYFTTPASTGVSATSLFEISGDSGTVSLNPVNLNTGGTGPAPGGVGGANNEWLHVATVPLTAGNTYTLTMTASAATFVSQRAHGVMWEFVQVPEPSTTTLAGMAGISLLAARRWGPCRGNLSI